MYLFFCVVAVCSASEGKPNIIIIMADDLGYSDLSCYRNNIPDQDGFLPSSMTPNIDKLASEGMLFTDFYSGSAVCSPSRSALITGRNATRNGIYNWIPEKSPMHLKSQEVTIAEMLRPQGYQTAHFGKWHLTSKGMGQPIPNDQGYDKLLPYTEDYDIKELANLKPDPNRPNWSMWGFQHVHMEFIEEQKIKYFELYN